METIIIICSIIFFIGFFVSLSTLSQDDKQSIIIGVIGAIVAGISATVIIFVGFAMKENEPEPPKYFPESEYSLEYIVTECDGKIDTTYALIPKNLH